jgi:predicted nucleotidyltransferase
MTMQFELSTLVGRHVDLVEQAGLRNPFRRAAIIQSKHVVYAA